MPSSRPTPSQGELLAEAERIDPSNLKAAQAALRAIADRWDAIGKAPRDTPAAGTPAAGGGEEDPRRVDASRIDPEAQACAEQFRSRAQSNSSVRRRPPGRNAEAAGRSQRRQWREGSRGGYRPSRSETVK